MDEGDIAADYQARHNAAALEEHRRAMARAETGPGSEMCEECGDDIPAARRQKQPGCTRCVDCQSAHERLAGGM
jgi:phage/conjugal plasmid C-4 type zinc finger TraR family protein